MLPLKDPLKFEKTFTIDQPSDQVDIWRNVGKYKSHQHSAPQLSIGCDDIIA